MTAFAFGAKCGGFGASGLAISAASRPSRESIEVSATPPRPPPSCQRNWRRSVRINEFVRIQKHPAKLRETVRFHERGSGFEFGGIRRAAESEREGPRDLCRTFAARIRFRALREAGRLLLHE